jgi:hypothetical protein
LPTRSPMARVRREIDTFTIPEGRRRQVYQPCIEIEARGRALSSQNDARELWQQRRARVRSGSWPCKNSSALRGRRSISEELRIMKLNHPAQIRRDTVLENCIFYISLMYEFLHSQGHERQNSF